MNKKFFIIDLFAGCGGMSEGFQQAGFEVISQIELDEWACQTLETRQLYYELKKINKEHYYSRYVREEKSKENIFAKFPEIKEAIAHRVLRAEFGKDDFENIKHKINLSKKYHEASKYNVVIGGPPCQAYSLIGRARDQFNMELDKRNFLYEYYLKILENLKPDFFVLENVPGIITAHLKGKRIFHQILEDFKDLNYEIAPTFDEYSENPREYLLDCRNYGIPQRRQRVLFIGYKKNLVKYNKNIKNIFKKLIEVRASKSGGFTVSDAIGDLPPLKPDEGFDNWYGYYDNEPVTPYQKAMRKSSYGILNHKARPHMKSDLERYKFFIEHPDSIKRITIEDLLRERPDLTPAHNHLDKFIDRFTVQLWNKPASTITAHICKDGHYFIHPDPSQCRSFTVREAARCQSFSDNFKFEGSRTQQFKQVGNAVPPLLARVIAKVLLGELEMIYAR